MCSIDWSAFGAMLGGLSTLALAIIAFMTRKAWYQQIVYQRRREIAEDLILRGQEVLSLIERMYYPYCRYGENGRMSKRSGESEEDFALRRTWGWREQALEEASGSVEKLRIASMLAEVHLEKGLNNGAVQLISAVESIVAGSRGMIAFQRDVEKNPLPKDATRESPVWQERSRRHKELENETWLDDQRLTKWREDYTSMRDACTRSLKDL